MIRLNRFPGNRDPAGHAALHVIAEKLDLHGHHQGQAARGPGRPEEGAGDCGQEQPDAEAVFGAGGEFEKLKKFEWSARAELDQRLKENRSPFMILSKLW